MATTSVASSSAGTLDVPSLVSQLMSVERRPIDNLNTKVASYQTKISSFGTLSGLVSSFQTALKSLNTSLLGYSATASDTSVFSAFASSTAAAGTYSLEVSFLAKAQSMLAAGQASMVDPIGGAGPTQVTFTVGGTPTAITINETDSLQGISDAINAANMGVSATIIYDGTYRLAISSNSTGVSSNFTITTDANNSAVDNLLITGMVNTPGQDAAFKVNGIQITSPSNTITDAIQGITLTLTKTTATPVTLTVARDTSAISTAVSGFVDAYNALASQLKSRSAYGTATSPAPALAGDGTVRLMQDQLRGILMTPASGGTLTSLSQVGVSYQADGTLKLDSSKLSSAMANNFSDVTNLFSSATGYVTRLDAWATSVVQTGGLIDTRTQSLNTFIKGYTDKIAKLEARMVILQKQYTTTYSNLNLLLNSMNSTSAYLSQQFSSGTQ